MYAMKGTWAGQTFALAKMNESESGGRKARVRRSIEERKSMAESFIKKYQKLNNGTFPSLNLTHKEVGGSFYTVREILREIIQENRVLGPAKLTNNDTDIFSQHYPLGSMAVEPQIHLDTPKENSSMTHVVPNQGQSEEVALNLNGRYSDVQRLTNVNGRIRNKDSEICVEEEKLEKGNLVLETFDQMVENGKLVNGHNVEIGRKEKTDKFKITESEICTDEQKIEEENIVVETSDEKVENGKFVSWHGVNIGEKEECDEFKSIESEICLKGEKPEEGNRILETHDENVENGNVNSRHSIEVGEKEEFDKLKRIVPEICLEGEKTEEDNKVLDTRDEKVENGKFASRHSVEIAEKENCDELDSIESEVSNSIGIKTDMKTEIVVETFPLRPVSSTTVTSGVDERKDGEKEADNINVNNVSLRTDLEGSSSCLAPEKVEANLTVESLTASSVICGDELETSCQNDEELPSQNQLANESNGNSVDNLINSVPLISESKDEVNNSKPDDQLRGGSTKTRDPTTLDRINLESWESTSKKRGRSEINPFLKAIAALVTAFIKFWSE